MVGELLMLNLSYNLFLLANQRAGDNPPKNEFSTRRSLFEIFEIIRVSTLFVLDRTILNLSPLLP